MAGLPALALVGQGYTPRTPGSVVRFAPVVRRAAPQEPPGARTRSRSPSLARLRLPASQGGGSGSVKRARGRSPSGGRALTFYEDDAIPGMIRAFDAALGPRGLGAKVSVERAAAALAGYLAYDAHGELALPASVGSKFARERAGVSASGLTVNTVKSIAETLRNTGRIRVEAPKARGPGVADEEELLDMEDDVKNFVREALNGVEADYICRATIQAYLLEKTGIQTSQRRVTKLCQAWGMGTAKLQRPKTALTAMHQFRRRIFTFQLRSVYDGGHHLGCTDQTFVNQRYQFGRSLCILNEPFSRWATDGNGLGKRLCIWNAMDCYGMCSDAPERPALGDLMSVLPTCEMMFMAQAGGHIGDYHGNTTHVTAMLWVNNRAVPFIMSKNPHFADGEEGSAECKYYMQIDNFAPHCVLTPCFELGSVRFDPRTLTKAKLVDAVNALYPDEFEGAQLTMPFRRVVDGDELLFIDIIFNEQEKVRKGLTGVHPNLPAIQAAVMDHMVEHFPRALENDMEHALRVGTNGNAKFFFGAARFCEGAFIEGAWVPPKTFVGLRYTGKMRSGQELWTDFGRGLTTNDEARPPHYSFKGGNFVPAIAADGAKLPSPAAVKLIEHYHRGADGGVQLNINADPLLRGPVEAAPRTLDTIVTPPEYAAVSTTFTRLVVNHMAAALFAAQAGVEAADAAQAFDDVDDEEEDDSDDE